MFDSEELHPSRVSEFNEVAQKVIGRAAKLAGSDHPGGYFCVFTKTGELLHCERMHRFQLGDSGEYFRQVFELAQQLSHKAERPKRVIVGKRFIFSFLSALPDNWGEAAMLVTAVIVGQMEEEDVQERLRYGSNTIPFQQIHEACADIRAAVAR